MIEPVAVTEQMMYATARIVGIYADGSESVGTGFFYRFPAGNGIEEPVTVLVTNKHVIEGTARTDFVVHTNFGSGKKPDGQTTVQVYPGNWVHHPDPNVDLCAVEIGSTLGIVKGFYRFLSPDLVPSQSQLEELSAVEDILMIGYPNGLWDKVNNYPLIRRGITASHPAVDFEVEGAAATVIDAACFPGSSGSPVLLHNVGSYVNKGGGTHVGNGRTFFLGILFSGPVQETDGHVVIRNIPTKDVPVAEIRAMMNLGYIVKARELDGLKAPLLAHLK